MHNYRLNTFAAIAIILFFGIGATTLIVHAIEQIDWGYVRAAEILSS